MQWCLVYVRRWSGWCCLGLWENPECSIDTESLCPITDYEVVVWGIRIASILSKYFPLIMNFYSFSSWSTIWSTLFFPFPFWIYIFFLLCVDHLGIFTLMYFVLSMNLAFQHIYYCLFFFFVCINCSIFLFCSSNSLFFFSNSVCLLFSLSSSLASLLWYFLSVFLLSLWILVKIHLFSVPVDSLYSHFSLHYRRGGLPYLLISLVVLLFYLVSFPLALIFWTIRAESIMISSTS